MLSYSLTESESLGKKSRFLSFLKFHPTPGHSSAQSRLGIPELPQIPHCADGEIKTPTTTNTLEEPHLYTVTLQVRGSRTQTHFPVNLQEKYHGADHWRWMRRWAWLLPRIQGSTGSVIDSVSTSTSGGLFVSSSFLCAACPHPSQASRSCDGSPLSPAADGSSIA